MVSFFQTDFLKGFFFEIDFFNKVCSFKKGRVFSPKKMGCI